MPRSLLGPLLFTVLLCVVLCGCDDEPSEPVGPELEFQIPDVKAASVGTGHTCALFDGDRLACWGSFGLEFAGVPDGIEQVTKVRSGHDHICAVHSGGQVTCWGGNNAFGEIDVPAGLASPVAIDADAFQTCAATADGELVCWGRNGSDQTEVPDGLGAVTHVALANQFSAALHSGGQLTYWGWGHPRTEVPDYTGISQISAAGDTLCFIHGDSELACWDFIGEHEVPTTIQGSVTDISVGQWHVCAVGVNQQVTCQIWTKTEDHGQANPPADLGRATNIYAGYRHTCAVQVDGELVCWGADHSRQATVSPRSFQ